jgi:DNA polymerase-3 subunit beta
MDVTFPNKAYRAAVEAAADALPRRFGVIPALTLMRIEAHPDGRVTFEGTSIEFGVRAETKGEVRSAGSICLPGIQLADIAAECDPNGHTVLRTEGTSCVIEAGRSRYRLDGVVATEYLGNPDPGTNGVSMPGEVLRTMAARVAWLASKEETHGSLCGVLMETTQAGIRLVASNTRQLAMSETAVAGFEPNLRRVVPPQLLAKAEQLLKGRGPIEVSIGGSTVGLRTADITLTARTLGADYPLYQEVLPRNPSVTVGLPTAEILRSVRCMVPVARSHPFKAMLIGTGDGHLRLWTKAPDVGTARDRVDAVVSGAAHKVAVHAELLADVLATVAADDVRIRFHGPNRGILIDGRGTDAVRSLWMVMPVSQEAIDTSEPAEDEPETAAPVAAAA